LAAHGIESPLATPGRRLLANPPDAALLVDPQISGGLLLGFPPGRAIGCLQRLRENGINAAIIGEVEPAQEGAEAIRLE
jgi:selenophosphate synthase